MPEYKIDIGNSNTGQIGAVAYLHAKSKRHALARFRRAAGYDNNDITIFDGKIHIYFNPSKVALKDVERVED